MTGKELVAVCPLFSALADFYCVMSLRRKGVFRRMNLS